MKKQENNRMSHHVTKIPKDQLQQQFDLGTMLKVINDYLTEPSRKNKTVGGRLFNDLMDTLNVSSDTEEKYISLQIRPITTEQWKCYMWLSKPKQNDEWVEVVLHDIPITDDVWAMGKILRNEYKWERWYECLFNILWNRLDINPRLVSKRRIEFQIPYKTKPNTHIIGEPYKPLTYHE